MHIASVKSKRLLSVYKKNRKEEETVESIRTIDTTLLYCMRNRRKIEMLGEEKVMGVCTEREERRK